MICSGPRRKLNSEVLPFCVMLLNLFAFQLEFALTHGSRKFNFIAHHITGKYCMGHSNRLVVWYQWDYWHSPPTLFFGWVSGWSTMIKLCCFLLAIGALICCCPLETAGYCKFLQTDAAAIATCDSEGSQEIERQNVIHLQLDFGTWATDNAFYFTYFTSWAQGSIDCIKVISAFCREN